MPRDRRLTESGRVEAFSDAVFAITITLTRQVHLDDAYEPLMRYSYASHRKAVALVRAARLYVQALWIADSDPNQAWLYLVSACEVAADEVTHRAGSRRKGRR